MFARVSGFFSFIALATFLGAASATSASLEMRVSYGPSNDWLGFFVAMDQNIFQKRNIHVTPTLIPSSTAVMGALVSESVEIAGMSSITFLQGYESGIPIVMIAGAHALPTPMHIGILARTGSGVKAPKDLVGRKVGLANIGSILNLVGNGWLMDNNVDPGKITYVEIPWSQQPDVLKSGQIDAVLTADPFHSRIKSTEIGYEFGDIYERAPPGTLLTTYVATRAWAEKNPGALRDFRAAIQDANDFISANPDSARASLIKWAKLPPEIGNTLPIPNFKVEVGAEQTGWLVELGKRQSQLQGGADVSTMIAK